MQSAALKLNSLGLAIVLSSCTRNPAPTAVDYTAMAPEAIAVQVDVDAFDPVIEHLGPEIYSAEGPGLIAVASYRFRLRGFEPRPPHRGETIHQLYVAASYSDDWRYFRGAFLLGGISLPVIDVDGDVDCGAYSCNFQEDFAIMLTEELLHDPEYTRPLMIKIKAKSGHEAVLTIPWSYIAAYLASFETDHQTDGN